jgi:hypothetical protein
LRCDFFCQDLSAHVRLSYKGCDFANPRREKNT